MRCLLALLYAACALCLANPVAADTDSSVSPKFRGDRIVIFQDDSPAFAAFAENVLGDPEVAAFMNEHFAVYTVEIGSPQAGALPFLGGRRLEPRVVIVAPRLDNMAAFIQPSFSKVGFLAMLQAVNRAQTMQDFLAARGGFAGPTADDMTAWAREFYPALTEPGAAPDGLLVGVLISREMKVLAHSAAIAVPGALVSNELQRMFPQAGLAERGPSGASCFGRHDANRARYCVYWVLAPN